MTSEQETYCYYSDLPSPLAYIEIEEPFPTKKISDIDVNRIIEMAWEDRTTFDSIQFQFGINESAVKALMKSKLKFSSYKLWRQRMQACKTKHAKTRLCSINRFKCNLQRNITYNKISKRHTK